MKFKFIDTEGSEYEKERMLRWEVLNKPLGLPPGSEERPEEATGMHLVAVEKKNVVGCVCAQEGEIFQMAVSEEYRGRGFGRKLMHTMENTLFEKGLREVWLYARQDAVGFYEKMGYRLEGTCVKKDGATCLLMKKHLDTSDKTDGQ